jgi:short subunit dehydrogenase-like uncharacterized protein
MIRLVCLRRFYSLTITGIIIYLMTDTFLLYGSTGFVGEAIARLAVQRGLRPLLAGRSAEKLAPQAGELGLDYRAFALEDTPALERALSETGAVLHCAGPYVHTFQPMVDACLRCAAHYLDITGEIPVYQSLFGRDERARERGVMILPGVGFDVVPTDCLAVYLKRRLPSATNLTLAFHSKGRAGLPPGTANTMVETLGRGGSVMRRRGGRLEAGPRLGKSRGIDFGDGPRPATLIGWGDVFMAFHSTGIGNIEVYSTAMPRLVAAAVWLLKPAFRLPGVRRAVRAGLPAGMVGSTPEQRAGTRMVVWGQVEDLPGNKATARLYGPEAGVEWTARAALAAVQKVLGGDAPPGFQTPATAYGPDFVLECEGVRREDGV